ncbi:GT-D fold domain-containing glycosyltransferase [Paenibacillus timonensis]|uniref:GT-D fold domain-containing glycosyltransferase n=3 Tax=Paenibacillus TaxID=44249 RepID=A0ABW3S6N3_9BACL|nr:GT-D fold domain-containing glycosyltransferase [Paenibacillus timonensis]
MQQIYLETQDLLKRIEDAIENRKPFSLVRIGDGENLVMAQHHVWPLSKVLQERWAMKANRGEKGVTLPNLPLRNAVVSSVKRATVVGILPAGDASINAPDYLKRGTANILTIIYAKPSDVPGLAFFLTLSPIVRATPPGLPITHLPVVSAVVMS